jgi:hypothetical protein
VAVIVGASKRDRTAGLRFTRAPLYRLSYAGMSEIIFKVEKKKTDAVYK